MFYLAQKHLGNNGVQTIAAFNRTLIKNGLKMNVGIGMGLFLNKQVMDNLVL